MDDKNTFTLVNIEELLEKYNATDENILIIQALINLIVIKIKYMIVVACNNLMKVLK